MIGDVRASLSPNPRLVAGSAPFAADPHPVYDALRVVAPVVRDDIGWSTVDYAMSDAAFHDPALAPGIDHLLVARGIGHLWGRARPHAHGLGGVAVGAVAVLLDWASVSLR